MLQEHSGNLMYVIYILILLLITGALYVLWRAFLRWCEQANRIDWGNPWINRIDGLNRHFCRFYHRLQFDDLVLPEAGPAVVVANHISGLDPFLLLAAARRPLRFMIAREEYQRFGLTWLFKAVGCIPVDREKRPDRALRAAMEVLARGEVVALFPHGAIQTHAKPNKALKGGAVRLAQSQGCLIYPVLLGGVAGHGHTFRAFPLRSKATLKVLEPIDCATDDYKGCMESLARILNAS